jgi:hypothetical protein
MIRIREILHTNFDQDVSHTNFDQEISLTNFDQETVNNETIVWLLLKMHDSHRILP